MDVELKPNIDQNLVKKEVEDVKYCIKLVSFYLFYDTGRMLIAIITGAWL